MEESYYRKIFRLKGSFEVPMSAYNQLELIEDYGFGDNTVCQETVTINVKMDNIVGTRHEDYANLKNWLEFFNRLKRAKDDHSIKYYAEYFNSDACKSFYAIELTEYKSKFWIGQGNHRICIAKILGLESITVPVSRYY